MAPQLVVVALETSMTFLGAFSYNLRISSTFHVELIGAMISWEIAQQKGWSQHWLETDLTKCWFHWPSSHLKLSLISR